MAGERTAATTAEPVLLIRAEGYVDGTEYSNTIRTLAPTI
jgi:hypothetical protein